jgi:hypothetical protein
MHDPDDAPKHCIGVKKLCAALGISETQYKRLKKEGIIKPDGEYRAGFYYEDGTENVFCCRDFWNWSTIWYKYKNHPKVKEAVFENSLSPEEKRELIRQRRSDSLKRGYAERGKNDKRRLANRKKKELPGILCCLDDIPKQSKKAKKGKDNLPIGEGKQELQEIDVIIGFMRLSSEKRIAYFEDALRGVEHRIIGDFIVSKLPKFLQEEGETEDSKSLVIHLKSGQWGCFSLCYFHATEMLLKHPESETELLQELFGK